MGDQHQSRALAAGGVKQQVANRLPSGLVEIAGWLVGKNQFRLDHRGAGDRDALLLAA